mgnify:CR=1 FL=1
MSLEGHAGVSLGHALAVVNHLNECTAGVFDDDGDVCGAGVNGVFHQLLDNGGGSLDDFTGSYLVGDVVGE